MFTVEYNVEGYVTSFEDGSGVVKTFDYDYDTLRGEYYAMVRNRDGDIEEYWFDRDGQEIRQDINGEERAPTLRPEPAYELDENGNVTRITYPDGSTIQSRYDLESNRLLENINELGVRTLHDYDAAGNPTSRVEAAGTPLERASVSRYDAYAQLLEVTQCGTGGQLDATITYAYDRRGNTIAHTDAEGHTTHMQYDELGNLLTLTNALGQVWSNRYDAAGQLIEAWNPAGRVASNAYDVLGHVVRYVDAGGRMYQYEHDSKGRITKVTDSFGRVSTREYDAEGNRRRR